MKKKKESLVIYSERVVLPQEIGAFSITIEDGTITAIQKGKIEPKEIPL
jgi:hypothetical protein